MVFFLSLSEGREEPVFIKGIGSKSVPLTYGVSQGSVLGSVLFTHYTVQPSELFAVIMECHFS